MAQTTITQTPTEAPEQPNSNSQPITPPQKSPQYRGTHSTLVNLLYTTRNCFEIHYNYNIVNQPNQCHDLRVPFLIKILSEMPRSEEAEHWANAVYTAIQEIPPGRVTSYGHIALLLGEPLFTSVVLMKLSEHKAQRPRQVGVCLKALPDPDSNAPFNCNNVPWQRVVNSKGMISHRGPGSAQRQAEVLRIEGVEVKEDSMGEFHVDFSLFGWFPAELPSEAES